MLLSLHPHMHLRGKSMLIEAEFPGENRREVLLNVPAYDFGWQQRYVLAQPGHLPVGTVIRTKAVFDNTAANPRNPDPSAVVREGESTLDEMCVLALDVCKPEPASTTPLCGCRPGCHPDLGASA